MPKEILAKCRFLPRTHEIFFLLQFSFKSQILEVTGKADRQKSWEILTSFLKIDRAIFSTNYHNKFVLIAMRNFTMRKKVNRIIRRVQFCKNSTFVWMEKICYFVKVGNNCIILPWTCISYYFLNDFYEVRLKNAVATHFKNIHTVHNIMKGNFQT